MSNRFYRPTNESGKVLVPVDTPKTNTSASSTEFIHISWLNTTDSFVAEPTTTQIATNKAVAEAVKSLKTSLDSKASKFSINGIEVDDAVTFAAGEGASVAATAGDDGAITVTFTPAQATATTIGSMKLYSTAAAGKEDGTYTAKYIDSLVGNKREITTEDFTIVNGKVQISLAKADGFISFIIGTDFYMPEITFDSTNYICTFFDAEDAHYNDNTQVAITYIKDLV